MLQTKTCTKCGETKSTRDFYANGKGGLRSECSTCTKAANAAKGRDSARAAEARYRAKHRVELAERVQAWRKANPERWSEINVKAQKSWRERHGGT